MKMKRLKIFRYLGICTLLVLAGCDDQTQIETVTGLIPEDGDTTFDTTPTLSWDAVAGAARYEVQGADTAAESTSDATPPTLLSQYEVQSADTAAGVKKATADPVSAPALDSDGQSGAWSSIVSTSIVLLDSVEVNGGSFEMGSPDDESGRDSDEGPVHTVTVGDFIISRYEITFAQYDTYVAEVNDADIAPSPSDSGFGREDRPVINVSWYDAARFLNWLSGKEGLTPAYTIGDTVIWNEAANGWRLPTEGEWEYAARGGEDSLNYTYAGSDTVGDVGWYWDNSEKKTHPVGGKGANELGLYDMNGNVYEWCWDWDGRYSPDSQTDPTGPLSGSFRLGRGGSWYYYSEQLRSANRFYNLPSEWSDNLGFRPVRRM